MADRATSFTSMGQPVTVLVKPSTRPGVVRFEINRSLTGMAGERYRAGDEVDGVRPVDELARRLLADGSVEAIHVNSNVITVESSSADAATRLQPIVEDLFLFYRDSAAAAASA
jgi:hypothetical protein